MRTFLLWIATMCVGGATFLLGMMTVQGEGTALLAGIVLWTMALAVGLVLSAPAFLDPPDGGGMWSFRVPIGVWLFLFMLKVTSWVGFYVLLAAWTLIFHLWQSRNTGRRPSFGGGASGPDAARGPVQYPSAPAIMPPAWLSDPTGRNTHRYWDGARWTNLVANGSVQAVDPL